ncbi:hypothetical protein H0H92_000295, partial [Tricholoma furcatifolium]
MGITVIPESVRAQSGMQAYVEEADKKQPQAYLAKMQGTCRPILPIHTMEKKLFNQLMRECDEFRSSTSSIKPGGVKIWNRYAETEDNVYYKLEEHLTAHFNGKWQENANAAESLSQVKSVTEPLQKRLRNPARTQEILSTPMVNISGNKPTHGFDNVSNPQSYQRLEASASAVQAFAHANNLGTGAAEST